jgi:hypothetical protein
LHLQAAAAAAVAAAAAYGSAAVQGLAGPIARLHLVHSTVLPDDSYAARFFLSCAGRPWQLVDELVTDVASPHTRNLLQQYRKESQVGPPACHKM